MHCGPGSIDFDSPVANTILASPFVDGSSLTSSTITYEDVSPIPLLLLADEGVVSIRGLSCLDNLVNLYLSGNVILGLTGELTELQSMPGLLQLDLSEAGISSAADLINLQNLHY